MPARYSLAIQVGGPLRFRPACPARRYAEKGGRFQKQIRESFWRVLRNGGNRSRPRSSGAKGAAVIEAGLGGLCGSATVREAIAKAEKHRPNLVVMDIAMLELNGLEAIRLC
jgi:CheY-like chemotaxis protein